MWGGGAGGLPTPRCAKIENTRCAVFRATVQPRSRSVALAAAASVLENGIYTAARTHASTRFVRSVDTPTCRTKKIASMPSELAGAMSDAPAPRPPRPAG